MGTALKISIDDYWMVILPTLANAIIWFIAARYINDIPIRAYSAGILSSLVTIGALMTFYIPTIYRRYSSPAMLFNTIAVIYIYAYIYWDFGLVYAGAEQYSKTALKFSDALYFSTVSFTTLGYGDFQPDIKLRILAGIQAFSGYIYLGFIISIVASWGKQTSETS